MRTEGSGVGERSSSESSEQQRQLRLLKHMPGFVVVLRGSQRVYEYVNDAYIAISGTARRDNSGK